MNTFTDSTSTLSTQPILVLGGTGKTGRRVVERLQARQIPVRLGSRGATPAFDWETPSTWPTALAGSRAVYLSFYPDLAVPGAPEAIGAFTRQALEAGVRRLVLLSGRGEEEAQHAEAVLQASGAEWTILRCSWFMQNFSEGAFLPSLQAGMLSLPIGAIEEPFVDTEDIADVAMEALIDPRHAGQLYELTGPRLMSFAEAVEQISHAAQRPMRFQTIPMHAFADELRSQGQPDLVVEFLEYLFVEVLDGRNATLADGVQRALGRAPRDFTDYARRVAASGVWAG